MVELVADGTIDACLAIEPNISMGEARASLTIGFRHSLSRTFHIISGLCISLVTNSFDAIQS